MSKFGEGGEFRNCIAAITQIWVHIIMHVGHVHIGNMLSMIHRMGLVSRATRTFSFHSPFVVLAGENSGQNLGLLSWKKQRSWSSKVQRN